MGIVPAPVHDFGALCRDVFVKAIWRTSQHPHTQKVFNKQRLSKRSVRRMWSEIEAAHSSDQLIKSGSLASTVHWVYNRDQRHLTFFGSGVSRGDDEYVDVGIHTDRTWK